MYMVVLHLKVINSCRKCLGVLGFWGAIRNWMLAYSSEKFAPLNTKREQDDWRAVLKRVHVVDAMDRCFQWYEATVINGEERTETLMPMIKIGFR